MKPSSVPPRGDYHRFSEPLAPPPPEPEAIVDKFPEEGPGSIVPDLQAQIDETLEEIKPHCVLKLLVLPLTDEFKKKKRDESRHRVRNILWSVGGGGAVAIAGGYTREKFMSEAFLHLTTVEQADLFLATPKIFLVKMLKLMELFLHLLFTLSLGKKLRLIQDAGKLFQQLKTEKQADFFSSYVRKNLWSMVRRNLFGHVDDVYSGYAYYTGIADFVPQLDIECS